MPSLEWIGKKAVQNHHRDVPFRLLEDVPEHSAGAPESGNLLIQGDNLEALKALLPYYVGQVKCIYIDPPYNTGDEAWIYNDAVNSPEMRDWLGKAVGKEAEDLSRHDKWLCMMLPRLKILREFLTEDGVIFVSMDENELGHLLLLMAEIFGPANNLGTLVWKRRSPSAMRGMPLSIDHEYVLAYAKDVAKTVLYGTKKQPEDYPLQDDRGRYASTDLTIGMTAEERPGQFFDIKNPRTGAVFPGNPERVWRFYPETMNEVIKQGLVIWPDEAGGKMERPRYKTYYDPESKKPKPVSSWIQSLGNEAGEAEDEDRFVLRSGMTQEGGKLLHQILGRKTFAYPKPLSLITNLVSAATGPNDLVLDSFAGSATTGHAVLEANSKDGGSRNFILIELDSDIAVTIGSKRLSAIVNGYSIQKKKGGVSEFSALGSGFRFCRLGKPLFAADGKIADHVTFEQLARHVFFAETGEPLRLARRPDTPYLGSAAGTAVYLLFNGILKDKSPQGGNVLTRQTLDLLPPWEGSKVVFGTACRLSDARLRQHGITFRQIPYEIKVD